jgi:hypothetical protein
MELFRYFKGLVKSAKLADSAKRVLGAPWPGKSYRPEGRGNNLLTIATYLRRSRGGPRKPWRFAIDRPVQNSALKRGNV